METKIVNIMFVLLLLPLVAEAQETQSGKREARVKYTAAEYIKNYALSACIASNLEPGEDKMGVAGESSFYFSHGDIGIETRDLVNSLIDKYLAKKSYSMGKEEKFTMMKCIDLYHSKELALLVKNHYKKEIRKAKKHTTYYIHGPNERY